MPNLAWPRRGSSRDRVVAAGSRSARERFEAAPRVRTSYSAILRQSRACHGVGVYSLAVDDLALVVGRARRGDRRAFGELYARFHRAVHGVVLARVAYQDAADLVQDVFAAALERLPQLGEVAAFPGWLMAIARNRAIDHVRGKKPSEELGELPGPPARAAEVAQVLAALRELPEAYQETLVMRLVEGMTGPEIAAQTGLAEGSVRVNLHRGMKLLRERLGIDKEAADVG
ncbi:MAG: sigma-70 family RNA polymerase sigma factor [Deltaproteobacteria bacterium]|nr:sigma-70 family RNA polymerase sigma factor [Deltaproteobacteria bacterium]